MKNNVIKNITNKTLGILGGGQLGKMIAIEASRLGIKTCIFDPNENAPAFQNANIIVNSDYNNKKALKKFVKHSDKVTYEFENIPLESLNFLEKNSQIFPGSKALKYSQDRLLEKEFISNLGITVAPFYQIKKYLSVKDALEKLKGENEDVKTGIQIISKAIEAPIRQIVSNSGGEGAVIVSKIKANKDDYGYNAKTDTFEPMLKAGIIDPTKVTRVALENAASVAGMLLTTECVLADIPEENNAPPMGGGMPGGGMPGMM